MKAWGLLILLLLPWFAMAQGQYYGARAAAIRLSEQADPSDSDRITIRTGDVITPENVRASIEALYQTGHYRYIEVDATPAPNGVSLNFRVQRHFFFSTF